MRTKEANPFRLVRQTSDLFQRTEIRTKTVTLTKKTTAMPAEPTFPVTPVAKPSPLDLLDEAHQKLTDAVEEFEVALTLTKDYLAQQKADLIKLDHLRAVFKEL